MANWKQVIPLGFEPKTHSLEGCCSIQLSYGTSITSAKVVKLLCAKKQKEIKFAPCLVF